jgi:hypothetical protein
MARAHARMGMATHPLANVGLVKEGAVCGVADFGSDTIGDETRWQARCESRDE